MAVSSSSKATFSFEAGGTDSELRVIRFHGREAISDLFEFEVDLVSVDPDIDFDAILQGQAMLSINWEDQVSEFHGVLREFEQFEMGPTYTKYRGVLVPKLWLLATDHQCRIFQNQTIPEIVSDVLKEHGFSSEEYEFRLKRSYPKREYVVQYQETDFNFISRWLEHEGIFYFFTPEKLLFGDDPSIHAPIPGDSELVYHPPAGLEPLGQESVHALICRQRTLPKKVTLKDYNYRKPSLDLKTEDEGAQGGHGTFMEYGDHYKNIAEGRQLAKVRGEEFDCRKQLMIGESDSHSFRSGYKYNLSNHYRPDFNQEYLLIEVSHFGSQTGASAEGGDDQSNPPSSDYSNEFVSVPGDVSFRPERKTPKPKLYGTMNAKVDAAGSGQYAEIDEQGRYKVKIPFDLSGKGGGKASRYIRMAQPYAGPNYGMHFPLHKGIEVIWTCIDGDPDRPIICGSVPDPETSSPVTSANQTESVVRDYSGNEISLEGIKDGEQVSIHSPKYKSTVTLGAPGACDGSIDAMTDSKIAITSNDSEIFIEASTQITLKVGASSLFMDKAGNIVLDGKHIVINGSTMVDINPD